MNTESVLAQWHEAERRARAGIGSPGVASRQDLRARSGLQFFEDMLAGRLPGPPIGELMDFVPVEFEVGRFVFQGTPGARHYNPIGTVHGGYAATLLDSCVGCAIHTQLPAGKGYTTLELKVNYVRPLTAETGPIRAEGKVVSLTNQIGIAEGRIVDVRGKLYAYATTTCLLFPLPDA
ncbi:thioesterase [Cupriavidus sp. USMAA2-4]|uniref:Thioesterase n=1 Tax=Cupriavidus malaysiensis TaxID=367825 RepID=A0ABM6F6D0_9BURK|nr:MULTISPECIES: PaaI family thioesterase [Cupriavidus]AOY93348.1 thioesterase [Cupriavidus sp. USMAA2-4]AOZ00360.1 thioesterase [Cupriavidus sp. USMAHM13]AOZ07106.1 thioesterase [Cupriavidus malaysiensis]